MCETDGTKQIFTSEYPEGAKGPNQYGEMVRILVYLLYLNRIRAVPVSVIPMQLPDAAMSGFLAGSHTGAACCRGDS